MKKKTKNTKLNFTIPSYNYVEKLPTPGDNGVSASGDVGTLLKDIVYLGKPAIPMFFGTGSNNSKKYKGRKGYYNTGGALGNYYKIPSGYKKNGKQKYICVDNIPRLPFINGIIPGMMKDISDLNPLDLFKSFTKNPSNYSFKECFQDGINNPIEFQKIETNMVFKNSNNIVSFLTVILLLIMLYIFVNFIKNKK